MSKNAAVIEQMLVQMEKMQRQLDNQAALITLLVQEVAVVTGHHIEVRDVRAPNGIGGGHG